jgi:Flp pilus assembly protein TadD
MTLIYAGRPDEAIPLLQKAIRLSPLGSTSNFVFLGHALRMTGRLEEAVSAYQKALQLSPHNIFPHIGLAVTYIQTAREKEARSEVAEILRLNPKFSLDSFAKTLSYKDQSVTDNFVDSLRKAGLK